MKSGASAVEFFDGFGMHRLWNPRGFQWFETIVNNFFLKEIV